MEVLAFLFLVNLFLSFVAGWIAKNKGRSSVGYFLFSFFLSFILAILVLIAIPPLKPTTQAAQTRDCPFCKEEIFRAAIVCKHCGRDVEPFEPLISLAESQGIASKTYKGNRWLTFGAILLVISLFMIWSWLSSIYDSSIPTSARIISAVIDLSLLALAIVFVIKGNIKVADDNPELYRKRKRKSDH